MTPRSPLTASASPRDITGEPPFPVRLAKPHTWAPTLSTVGGTAPRVNWQTLKFEAQVGHLKAPGGQRVYFKVGIKIMNKIKDTLKLKESVDFYL